MKHYELEISQFVDNELFADEQKELFAHLSTCEECTKTLADFMKMKYESKSFYKDMDAGLKQPVILPAIERKKGKNIYKTLFYFSAAASIILGVLFLMRQSNNTRSENKYAVLEAKYNQLTVKHNSAKIEMNKSVVKEKSFARHKIPSAKNKSVKMSAVNPVKDLSSKTFEDKNFKTSRKVQKIEIVQVTKNDFLTPQIVGN